MTEYIPFNQSITTMNFSLKNNFYSLADRLRRLKAPLFCLLLALLFSALSAQGASKAREDKFTVVIDAGHGGHDHGAIDNGVREKDINLAVAKRLASLIKKKLKSINVVMTRDDDTFVSLQERANIANNNKGDLFISIHTNSVDKNNPNRTKVSGASVYALGPQKDADNLRVAQRENAVIELERNYKQKYSGFDPSKDESYIIFEMAQKKNLGRSLRFAEKAQKELVKSGRANRGVRQAGFWVLWATSMPSVLVELDFICNPTTAKYLNSDKGQDELAEALFDAVEDYHKTYKKRFSENDMMPENVETVETVSESFTAEVTSPANDSGATESAAVHVAVSSERQVREHNANTVSRRSTLNGQRRRRSNAARELSDNRNLETSSIVVKSEMAYLVKDEVKETEEKTSEIIVNKTADTKNKKGRKAKKSKDKVEKKKPEKDKSKSSSKNKKRITVKNSSVVTATEIPDGKGGSYASTASESKKAESPTPTGFRGKAVSASPSHRVYKILLLSSSTELKTDDPAFKGFVPTGVFKENGLYKYTLGQSEDRAEIESTLLDIRTKLPEASIVVRME